MPVITFSVKPTHMMEKKRFRGASGRLAATPRIRKSTKAFAPTSKARPKV